MYSTRFGGGIGQGTVTLFRLTILSHTTRGSQSIFFPPNIIIRIFLNCVFSTLHSRLAGEHSQLKDELEAVRLDNVQLLREHDHAKQNCEELRRLRDDHQREVADMRLLHQQVACFSFYLKKRK